MASASVVLTSDTSGSVTVTVPSGTAIGTTTLTLPTSGGTIQTSGAGFTTNGVAYASSTSALTTGSALTWDGNAFNISSGANPSLTLTTSNTTLYTYLGLTAGTASGYLYTFAQSYAAVYPAGATVLTNNTWGLLFNANNASGIITYQINGSEKMRLTSSGSLLVNTTNNSITGDSTGAGATFVNASAGYPGFVSYATTSTAGTGIAAFWSNNHGTPSVAAYFRADGGLANYSANNSNLSDENLKKDIVLSGNYLEKICAIPVKNFRYKSQDESEDITLGVIAQDVEKVAPELVCKEGFGASNEKQNYLSIYQTDLQYALMKSIQELSTLITAQQSTIQSLTDRITALENKA